MFKSVLALLAVAGMAVGPAVSSAHAAPVVPSLSSALFIVRTDVVQAGDTDVWNLSLKAGGHYVIRVSGDGDTDLDAYLYDENGHLIDLDDDDTDLCLLEVTPRWSGPFTLKIVNRGSVWNRYDLIVR